MNRVQRLRPWVAATILLVMFALAVTSMKGDSPTFDEQGFLIRGLAYLRSEADGGNRHIRVGHPLGLNALNAALLVSDSTVRLPSDDPSWQGTSFHRPAELFLWEIGNDVEHIMFLARVPTIWLGLLLAAVGARWAAEISAGWGKDRRTRQARATVAGLVTLVLLAFDPNILAHMRLVTTDLGLAAGAVLAGYTLWRFVRCPSWGRAVMAGAGLGLLLNTKFTALLFLPLFGAIMLLGAFRIWRHGPDKHSGKSWTVYLGGIFIIYPLMAFVVLWLGNGLQIGSMPEALPIVGQMGGMTVPLSDYLGQLLDIGNRLQVSTPSFLLGQYSDSGWWYYFPAAFLLKTPLPTLLLLAVALAHMIRSALGAGANRSDWFDLAALWLPAAGYFAIAMTTDINLGYRHLLPILPFLYVFIGAAVTHPVRWGERSRSPKTTYVAVALLGWLVVASLWIYPHYLAFFNALAGGPDNGWKALVDSNIDWGQDLGRLADRLDNEGIDSVWLSYFGEARPEYYGIDYRGLDSFTPRLMNPNARPYFPYNPAPGWYAISATTLQGVHFADHAQFAYFRDREPAAKVGYSIFLFEQPAQGKPVNLVLGNLQVDQLGADDYSQLGTNDVSLRWIDAGQALILPTDQKPLWLALGDQLVHPLLASYVTLDQNIATGDEGAYRLFQATSKPPDLEGDGQMLTLGEGRVAYRGSPQMSADNGTVQVLTVWSQFGEPQPLKMFVHVLDDGGQIVSQWDGLSVAWEGWRMGDLLFQVSGLSTADLPSGQYRVVAGLYDPESLQRWQEESGSDIMELGMITVP